MSSAFDFSDGGESLARGDGEAAAPSPSKLLSPGTFARAYRQQKLQASTGGLDHGAAGLADAEPPRASWRSSVEAGRQQPPSKRPAAGHGSPSRASPMLQAPVSKHVDQMSEAEKSVYARDLAMRHRRDARQRSLQRSAALSAEADVVSSEMAVLESLRLTKASSLEAEKAAARERRAAQAAARHAEVQGRLGALARPAVVEADQPRSSGVPLDAQAPAAPSHWVSSSSLAVGPQRGRLGKLKQAAAATRDVPLSQLSFLQVSPHAPCRFCSRSDLILTTHAHPTPRSHFAGTEGRGGRRGAPADGSQGGPGHFRRWRGACRPSYRARTTTAAACLAAAGCTAADEDEAGLCRDCVLLARYALPPSSPHPVPRRWRCTRRPPACGHCRRRQADC
jgi:hypothetical protein